MVKRSLIRRVHRFQGNHGNAFESIQRTAFHVHAVWVHPIQHEIRSHALRAFQGELWRVRRVIGACVGGNNERFEVHAAQNLQDAIQFLLGRNFQRRATQRKIGVGTQGNLLRHRVGNITRHAGGAERKGKGGSGENGGKKRLGTHG